MNWQPKVENMNLKGLQIDALTKFSLLKIGSPGKNLVRQKITPTPSSNVGPKIEVLQVNEIRWRPPKKTFSQLSDSEKLTNKLRNEHFQYHYWHGEHTGYEYEENINYDTRYKDAAEIMIAFIPAIQSVRRAQYLRKTGPIARYFPDFV